MQPVKMQWWMLLLTLWSFVNISKSHEYCFADEFGGNSCKEKAKKCKWGYEDVCKDKQWYQTPLCHDVKYHRGFRNLDERIKSFWEETDFGYVRRAKPTKYLCKPKKKGDSSIFCNDQLTYCHGKNIYIDAKSDSLFRTEAPKDDKAVLFGGSCKIDDWYRNDKSLHRARLVTWAIQFDRFKELKFQPTGKKHCDVIVDKTTFIVDIDAPGNLYHHFCDYLNLYLSKHLYGSLKKDMDIGIWEFYKRRSLGPFGDTWKLFTNSDVYAIGNRYQGKRVCYKDVIFSLLPRMAGGMYYSTPVIVGCSHSGLFRAFSKYIVNGFKIKQERRNKTLPIRVTLLTRNTKYRKIVNQDELIKAMEEVPGIHLQAVTFDRDLPFQNQLQIMHNTDIFIGVHGAGLAHLLFMPNWGVLFELYNANDPRCYSDLAKLRGISYLTWDKKEKIQELDKENNPHRGNAKFYNFIFDLPEFRLLFQDALMMAKKNLASYFPNV